MYDDAYENFCPIKNGDCYKDLSECKDCELEIEYLKYLDELQ